MNIETINQIDEMTENPRRYIVNALAKFFKPERHIKSEILRLEPIRREHGYFSPFPEVKTNKYTYWGRSEEREKFIKYIEAHRDSHIILTGRSGAGKSTFLHNEIRNNISNIYISNYDSIMHSMVDALDHTPETVGAIRDLRVELNRLLLLNPYSSIHDFLRDPSLYMRQAARDGFADKFIKTFESIFSVNTLSLIIFDQVERFFSSLTGYESEKTNHSIVVNSNELLLLLLLFSHFRSIDNVVMIFSIRSDALFDAVEFISGLTEDDILSRQSPSVLFYYLDGLNSENSVLALDTIRKAYPEKCKDITVSWTDFAKYNGLYDAKKSNTFLIQITGYMLENFGDSDRRISKAIKNGYDSNTLLEYYFEHVIAAFYKENPSSIPLPIFKIILVTVATENKLSGESISARRCAALAHVPISSIQLVVKFLTSHRILVTDSAVDSHSAQIESVVSYRFAHDKVIDFLFDSESYNIRPSLQKSIEHLTERRIPTEKLTLIDTFGSLHKISLLSAPLYLFYAWGVAVISCFFSVDANINISPSLKVIASAAAFYPLYMLNTIDIFNVNTYEIAEIRTYYPVIFVAHCVWITYMYYLVSGYMKIVMAHNIVLRTVALLLVYIGVYLGIAFTFTPQFYVFPVGIVGVIMSIILILFGRSKFSDSAFGQLNRNWGWRTLINMIFVILLYFFHSYMVSKANQVQSARVYINEYLSWWGAFRGMIVEKLPHLSSFLLDRLGIEEIAFGATGFMLIWFWLHIRAEQQSEVSMADRLALYDRARAGTDE